MEAVCILLNQKPDWDTAKKVLSNTNFMQELKDFNKDAIPQATLKKLAKYIADPIMAVDNVSKVRTQMFMPQCRPLHFHGRGLCSEPFVVV